MTATLSAVAGLAGGVVIGVAVTLIVISVINPYAWWLGKTCWVRPCGKATWAKHVIVAASWRGAVCVRDVRHMDEDGYWIKKQNVRWRVRWDRPSEVRDGDD